MRIEVLGPIRVWHGEDVVDLGPTGQRAMLGLLVVASGQPMSRAELIDAVWGERPPPSATNMIQTRVKHLRRLLEPGRRPYARSTILPAVGDGYALDAPAADIDLRRFRDLVGDATTLHQQGDLHTAAALLRDALRLWQGRPLADIPFLAAHPKVIALLEQRRTALTLYGEAVIATGNVDDALPVLVEAAADDPLDEAVWARLIRAYQAAGRRAQAFDAYHETRRRLARELGVDPGPELAAAHAALLREDGTRTSSPAAAIAGRVSLRRPVPAQLPADTASFTGRAWQLQQLDDLLLGANGVRANTMALAALSGSAGVGKTALAVRWAHRVREKFPDGQLHVNLRGFDPSEVAVKPEEVMKGFLDAFGVPPQHVPTNPQALIGLYRSVLADRRVLIVLDNALDAEQVRPLLPGAPGCVVVVTSRNRLASLVATEGARPLTLDLLSTVEARHLLARRVGKHRTALEPDAVGEIITMCARLPLALSIVAARAAIDPALPLASLASRLRDARGTLDALTDDDQATDVRALFSWSYRMLSHEAARLFRLLGLHPGPHVGASTAASLAGVAVARIRSLLGELARAHLVAESIPGRYTMHDLLRAYAAELVRGVEPVDEQRAALRRVLDHYLRTAYSAALLLNPYQDSITLAAAQPDVTPEPLAEYEQAFSWFATEHTAVVAAIDQAAALQFPNHAWQLAATLEDFLNRRGLWHDWAATQRIALAAGRQLADVEVQARANRGLARACTRLGRYEEAGTHFRRAADLFADLGDHIGLAHTHLGTSYAYVCQGDHTNALHHAHLALVRYRAADDVRGQATALNMIGSYHARLNDHRQALIHCERGLSLYQSIGDRHGEANTWDSLGNIHHHLGEFHQAANCLGRALVLYQKLGDRYYEADTLAKLGRNHMSMGDAAAARVAWRRALRHLDELGHPYFCDCDAEEVRTELQLIELQLVGQPVAD